MANQNQPGKKETAEKGETDTSAGNPSSRQPAATGQDVENPNGGDSHEASPGDPPPAGEATAPSGGEGAPSGGEDASSGGEGEEQAPAGPEHASDQPADPRPRGFPIVGIGASAGGLEALEGFFESMPADTGMAFVVVTHQHPEHTSLLPDLLGRETEMPVVQAADGTQLQPNHVYVSPPGENLAILGGTLHMMEVDAAKSPRRPIDHFFRSLAGDLHQRAIGIVLSGTGTDGSLGLRAIKAEGGMAMVQQPQSAKFAGMPSSAVATGLADYVLPPDAMPDQLVAYTQGPYLQAAPAATPTISAEPMQKIFLLLRSHTGHDFSDYKASTIRRRIQRRMNVHEIGDPMQYVRYLKENPHETDVLFKELLISVTSFFRDREAWEALAAGPLRELLQSRPENHTFRGWVPGCATGEEVYTLAILLRECAAALDRPVEMQLFGTDLDRAAIETARLGRYPDGVAADVLPDRLEKYLVHEDGTYRVRQEVREMAIFAPQNVIKDPPFTKLDILCCRNLLIYLNAELQKRLLPIFHHALKPGGLLFLGPSETIGTFTDLFEPLDKKWKIFRRKETTAMHPIEIPAASPPPPTEPAVDHVPTAGKEKSQTPKTPSVERLIERLLLARHCPATVVVNDRGDILYIHGHTGAYFEPAEGQPRMNALDMARKGLHLALASALRQAADDSQEIVRPDVRIKTQSGHSHVDLTVLKISNPEAIRGLLLVEFRPAAPSPKAKPPQNTHRQNDDRPDHTAQLEREIEYLKHSQQATREDLETANQELKSTNEELQSTNEELQSSNEELETSKEEMQSLNEELNTVNAELHSKVEHLSHANDDMQNLLNSIDVATVFLDNDLNIKRFTESAKALISLRPSDVGRPLGDLSTNLRCDNLVDKCQEVLKTLRFHQQEVVSKDGAWYMMRIMPYRTTRNVIDGLVITLVNIDELKTARESAEVRDYFENLFETVRHPLIVLDEQLRVVSANRRFCRTFGVRSKEIAGMLLYEVGDQQWDIPELRQLLEHVLLEDRSFEDFIMERDFPKLGRKRLVLNGRRVEQEAGLPGLILLTVEEASETNDNP